jgi:ribonuclease HII
MHAGSSSQLGATFPAFFTGPEARSCTPEREGAGSVAPAGTFGRMATAVGVRTRRVPVPSLRVETACFDAGHRVVVGIDEVGRGAWAGPVSVGAVVVCPNPKRILKVRDSKLLTVEEREALYPRITAWATAFGVGHASAAECDELGMTAALRVAGLRALAVLAAQGFEPDRVILDGNHDYLDLPEQVQTVIDGDAHCLSVAAASVVAKVTRDRLMRRLDALFPHYGFASHVGYITPGHSAIVRERGPCEIHRRSFQALCYLPADEALAAVDE